MKINPGIQKTVKWLNDNGYKTCDSGDGKTHDYKCDRSYPYVVIADYPTMFLHEGCDMLKIKLKDEFGIYISEVNNNGLPCIQGTYDPGNNINIIELMNIDDEYLFGE